MIQFATSPDIIESDAKSFTRSIVKISSSTNNWNLDAWEYIPIDGQQPYPVIVMAHGLSANKLMSLSSYAEKFTELGFACVVFDYRRWGTSDGVPRHCLYVSEQLDDYRTVIKYCRTKPRFDPTRVVIWGFKFLCITLASEAGLNVRAAIAQCPYTGERTHELMTTKKGVIKTIGLAIYYLIKQALGAAPFYIRATAPPGEVGIMTTPGNVEGLFAVAKTHNDYPNEISASSLFEIPFYNPAATASRIACSILLVGMEFDNLCSFNGVLTVAELAQKAEIVRVPGHHFEPYPDQSHYKSSIDAQVAFLQQHVLS